MGRVIPAKGPHKNPAKSLFNTRSDNLSSRLDAGERRK